MCDLEGRRETLRILHDELEYTGTHVVGETLERAEPARQVKKGIVVDPSFAKEVCSSQEDIVSLVGLAGLKQGSR